MRNHLRPTGKVGTLRFGLVFGMLMAALATSALAAPVDADLLLRGGTVHDGSGAKPVVGDVVVRDGRILAVGKFTPGKIGRTIQCRGLVVAPGLIDVHTHTDGTLNQPGVRPCLNYLIQGCTTMITGNCGGGPLDVAKFLTGVETNSAGVNILALAPHGSIRSKVMGGERRAPTSEELERMKTLLGQAMRGGAWGMSTGLIYPPGSYAETDELIALARVVAAHGGVYVSHIRDEADHLLKAVEEAIRIGRESSVPVHISHFKSMEIPNWGRIRDAAAMIEKARAEGLKITADQYPYTANSFSLVNATLPEDQIQWCKRADLAKRMASDAEFAALVRRVIAGRLGRYEKIVIAASKKFPDYVGKSLKEIAGKEKIETVDLVLKIVAQEAPEVVCHSMSEKDVRWAMALPWVVTASDGAARAQNPAEHHHPRNFGTFARKIGRYAIQDKAIPLPHAIRSATGLPADIFGIPERGYLRPGYHADIAVFDPATYRDRATFEKPQEYATGVRYVFLAGQAAVENGKPGAKLFGRALRRGAAEQRPTETSVSQEKQTVLDWLSQPETVTKFGRISDAIWSYAELGLQEHKSSALLIKTLEAAGFTVKKGLADMPTCFVASYGSGKPVIGMLVEYDALPMLSQKGRAPKADPVVAGAPGHGCGHNLMASAATAAAIAVKQAMDKHKLTGTIKLFGSPAEEILVSRPYMVRAGLFKDVDAVINNHASSNFNTGYGVAGSAMISATFRFQGKTAHAGGAPWSGRSALDAVEIMNVAANYLREHLHFSARMHYVIPDGGEAPNVVPDRARVWYFLRGSDEKLMEMYERLVNCAKGAALATATELAETRVLAAAHQSHHNKALAELMMKNIELIGMPRWTEEEHAFAKALQKTLGSETKGMPTKIGTIEKPAAVFTGGASSDHGDVTLITPTATIRFPGAATGAQGHHWSTVACGFGSTAWKGANAGAKAMAASAIDLLTKPDALAAIRKEFAAYSKTHPYKSFLPANAKPPLEFYDKLMNQYRPAMEAFYLKTSGETP